MDKKACIQYLKELNKYNDTNFDEETIYNKLIELFGDELETEYSGTVQTMLFCLMEGCRMFRDNG